MLPQTTIVGQEQDVRNMCIYINFMSMPGDAMQLRIKVLPGHSKYANAMQVTHLKASDFTRLRPRPAVLVKCRSQLAVPFHSGRNRIAAQVGVANTDDKQI